MSSDYLFTLPFLSALQAVEKIQDQGYLLWRTSLPALAWELRALGATPLGPPQVVQPGVDNKLRTRHPVRILIKPLCLILFQL